MRKNPYEKYYRAFKIILIVFAVILVIACSCYAVIWFRHHPKEKKVVEETETQTEKIDETETPDWAKHLFDDTEAEEKPATETEKPDNGPEIRDVSPENDPNASINVPDSGTQEGVTP